MQDIYFSVCKTKKKYPLNVRKNLIFQTKYFPQAHSGLFDDPFRETEGTEHKSFRYKYEWQKVVFVAFLKKTVQDLQSFKMMLNCSAKI